MYTQQKKHSTECGLPKILVILHKLNRWQLKYEMYYIKAHYPYITTGAFTTLPKQFNSI